MKLIKINPKISFQDLIFSLKNYWSENGCVILEPYDMELGAGTFHPATTLRALGSSPWNVAYVQPSRRPNDGRYGKNPNRLQHYYQFQVLLKPSPINLQELYLDSLYQIGLDLKNNDVRFIEDDWESPTLGAWGLGWECQYNGMEISQVTYFQQICGIDCTPVSGELTYGLERIAMYLQNVDNVFKINFNGFKNCKKVTYGDIFLQSEKEYSQFNFDLANTDILHQHFLDAEKECLSILSSKIKKKGDIFDQCVLPAYDFCIKASHLFNLLQSRGVISTTERQSYILRIRDLACQCGKAYLKIEKSEI